MSAREVFEASGRLTKCPNPPHEFQMGRIIGEWRIAATCWSTLTDGGKLHHDALRVGLIEDTKGQKIFALVVWRFSLLIGVLPSNI